jgi:nicotinamide mononucleotide transporter
MLAELWTQFSQQSLWEALAVALGIAYVILAARESIWCWPAAFISTAIYTALFWQGQLPMQSLLNLFYLGMAVYGFMLWRRHDRPQDDLKIHFWAWRNHLAFIAIGTVLTLSMGLLLSELQASQKPYLDAFVTVFSVLNTYLMARKVLENWGYWLVIDSAAVVLYLQTGYLMTAAMFALYLGLAVYGLINWLKLYHAAKITTP